MKLKRLFTAILSAALTLSLCAMPAMADDGTTGTAGATTGPLKIATAIDWDKTGKLTIHKYETDSIDPSGSRDNGENSAVSGTGSKPLNGVTFKLYKVKNAGWLKDYYQGTSTGTSASTAMPEVSDFIKSDGTVQSDGVTLTPAATVTTGGSFGDGTAVASGLELGLYLVVETDKPDAVKQVADPFLVSIPMTAVNMTDWLYDVTVNPKNVTKYGAATLKKVGYTGSEPDGTVMSGYTFKLYKLIDGTWTQITKKPKNGQDNEGDPLVPEHEDGILTTEGSGTISVAGLTKGVYAFVETGVNSEQGYILDAGTAYVFKLDAEGAMEKATSTEVSNTSFGSETKTLNYDCVKSAATTTGTTTNLEVINYKPDLNKTVKDRQGNPSAEHTADYAIGDKVPFVLTIKVPENIAKLKTFTVTDKTDKNQLLHTQDVAVTGTAKGSTSGATPLTATTDYTITYNADSDGFTIDFKGTDASLTAINAYAGGTITITYSAILQKGAAVVSDTTSTANINSAELKYSSKTTVDSKPDDNPYTIHEEAAVYTFKAGIHKTDDAGTALDGVKFDLYKKFDPSTEVMVSTNDGVMYKGATVKFLTDAEATRLGLNDAIGSGVNWYLVEHDLTTNGDGKVVANGLPKGEYKFVETQTKADYNLLSKPVDADLRIEYKTVRGSDTTYNAGTKKHNVTSTTYKVGSEDYKYKDIEVINRKGFTLPVTGGFGTLLFSGIGLLLVLVGVSVLFSLKKKTNRA